MKTFEEWFKAQYGRRPKMDAIEALERLRDAEYKYKKAQRDYDDVREYESIERAALKAWCAAKQVNDESNNRDK